MNGKTSRGSTSNTRSLSSKNASTKPQVVVILRAYPKTTRGDARAGTSSARLFGTASTERKEFDDVPQSLSARTTAPTLAHALGNSRSDVALDPAALSARKGTRY